MRGKVYLIGAGPGDPELLTLKAARLLAVANVVLHDALVSDAVLAMISPAAELINVGKRAGQKLLRRMKSTPSWFPMAGHAQVLSA